MLAVLPRFSSFPISLGSAEPPNWLFAIHSSSNEVKSPMALGIDPVKALEERCNCFNEVRAPRETKGEPLKAFLSKFKKSKPGGSSTNSPRREFPERSRRRREDNPRSSCGKDPSRLVSPANKFDNESDHSLQRRQQRANNANLRSSIRVALPLPLQLIPSQMHSPSSESQPFEVVQDWPPVAK